MKTFHILCFLCINFVSISHTVKYNSLIWSDEFDYTGKPNPNLWYFQNNSLNAKVPKYSNSFTDQNAYVSEGYLTIVAKKEQSLGMNYSSAGILSMRGFRYGRFEMRAKLGGGRGTWANFLMSPDQRRTGTLRGEIDIAEVIDTSRFAFNVIHGSIHYNYTITNTSTKSISASGTFAMNQNPDTSFHVYSVEWDKDKMIFYVDDLPFHTYLIDNTTSADGITAYNISYIIQIHLTIGLPGGRWAGQDGIDDSIFPVYHVVDYIRVYGSSDSAENTLTWETIPKTSKLDISWAAGCNIPGNNFMTTQTIIPAHGDCELSCLEQESCTHFTWMNGTCYLKTGKVTKNTAEKGDPNMVCGIINNL